MSSERRYALIGHTHATSLSNIVEDTTPQLGGNLDVNGNKIVSVSNGDIDIEPNGTGNVLLGNLTFNADQTVGAGQDNYVLTYDNGTGEINLEAASGGISNVVEDTTPQLGGNLDLNSNTINGTGTIGITGAITATSYGGITEANLLDKSAAETITGAWVMSTSLNAVPLSRSISATETTATTDYGIIIALTGGSGQELTLDSDPPTNAWILVDNRSGNSWTIACATAANLIWAKDATTGDRTLADDGVAVAIHRGSGIWIINGSDLLT